MINKYWLHFSILACIYVTASITPLNAYAACSPGIPCLDYDIYSNTDSGTSSSFNGPKTGVESPYEESACDGNFMNQIYARATMEARRESVMSQQLIHKPDSVLEYTCFDKFIGQTAEQAGKLFTEIDSWDNKSVCLSTHESPASYGGTPTCSESETIDVNFDDDHLDDVLEGLLLGDLEKYIEKNFSHTFMGEALQIDNDLNTSSIDTGGYSCAHMATVWELAKCADFAEDDRFRTFAALIESDPRSIPDSCSSGHDADDSIEKGSNTTKLDSTSSAIPVMDVIDPCPSSSGPEAGVNTEYSNDLLRVANNCDNSASEPNAYATFDSVAIFNAMFKAPGDYIDGAGQDGGDEVQCFDPIPTGVIAFTHTYDIAGSSWEDAVTILEKTIKVHYEHICPNPGCYHVPVEKNDVSDLDTSDHGSCTAY